MWKRQLSMFTSDIKHTPYTSMVATVSPLGLKSRLVMKLSRYKCIKMGSTVGNKFINYFRWYYIGSAI